MKKNFFGKKMSLFTQLHVELVLEIFCAVKDPTDRVALCLAMPRFGIIALKLLKEYADPLIAIAFLLTQRRACEIIDERLLRRYAYDDRATQEGCAWLEHEAKRNDWHLHIVVSETAWLLMDGLRSGAMLRRIYADRVIHFCGEIKGKERIVKKTLSSGSKAYYEGRSGFEHCVRSERTNGFVEIYEGEKGLEFWVRQEYRGFAFSRDNKMGKRRLETPVPSQREAKIRKEVCNYIKLQGQCKWSLVQIAETYALYM